tara:strand:- start:4024 stop:6198 length:2175 start_codon:yes stop_codon:yes gene_type:complete
MARANSQINVAIALDTAPLEAGQKRAIRQFQKLGSAGDVAKGGLNVVGKGMKTVGLLGGAMAGAIGVASAKMVELGSDAEESANAFSVTFKEATDSLTGFVEDFSTKAGFTQAELQQLLSFTGGVVNGMGASAEASSEFAKQIAVLSGDIGSLRNIDPSDVLERITKSLTGEREGLKQLGIVLKQTTVDQKALTMTNKSAVSELTELERAQATLTLIQEHSSDALGDLDRTSDGFANTQRRLKAELRETATSMGNVLMPSVNELLPVISDLAEKVLPKMVEMFENGVTAVREFMKEFGSDILAGLQKGFQAFKDIGTIVGEAISRIIEFIRNNEILAKLFGQLTDSGDGFLTKLNEIAEGIRAENLAEERAERSRERRRQQYMNNTEATEDLTDATEDLTDAIDENTDSVDDQVEEIQFGAVEFNKYTSSIQKALSSIKTLTGLQERGKREQERLDEATADLEESNIAVAQAQIKLGDAQKLVSELQQDGTEVTAEEELAILNLKKQIEELTEAQDGSRQAELELILAKEELIELEAEATAQSDKFHDAVREVEKAEEDLTDAIEDQKQAREDQIQAKKDLAEATKVSAEMILTEALAIKELEKAFGSFEAGTFKRTLEEIALLTDRKISEIEQAFANAGLTAESFSPPTGGGGDSDTSDIVEAPSFAETGDESGGSPAGGGGSKQVLQPVKIFTTFSIDNERFETVTQDALINLQRQGKRVII